jgi:hypothetical protein
MHALLLLSPSSSSDDQVNGRHHRIDVRRIETQVGNHRAVVNNFFAICWNRRCDGVQSAVQRCSRHSSVIAGDQRISNDRSTPSRSEQRRQIHLRHLQSRRY